jgi:D-3-phosphoglycerate dehydrogenase
MPHVRRTASDSPSAGRPMTFRVVATDTPSAQVDLERRLFGAAGVEFHVADGGDLSRQVAHADAIMTCFRRVSAETLDAAVRCRTVARYGIGLDNIDVAHATQRGIVVTNVPAYCTGEVADHTLLLLLALARRLPRIQRSIAAGGWPGAADALPIRLAGRRLGVVGMGAIGRAVAVRAQALGMRIVAVARGTALPSGTEVVADLDALLAASDAVTVHVPLVAGTRGLIGARELALMKPGALLINTSRGALVDTAGLLRALEEGRIGGAGLDVADPEPLPPDHPLRMRDDVVLTSHLAFASDGSLEELVTKAVRNVLDVLADRTPASIVNSDVFARATTRDA